MKSLFPLFHFLDLLLGIANKPFGWMVSYWQTYAKIRMMKTAAKWIFWFVVGIDILILIYFSPWIKSWTALPTFLLIFPMTLVMICIVVRGFITEWSAIWKDFYDRTVADAKAFRLKPGSPTDPAVLASIGQGLWLASKVIAKTTGLGTTGGIMWWLPGVLEYGGRVDLARNDGNMPFGRFAQVRLRLWNPGGFIPFGIWVGKMFKPRFFEWVHRTTGFQFQTAATSRYRMDRQESDHRGRFDTTALDRVPAMYRGFLIWTFTALIVGMTLGTFFGALSAVLILKATGALL